MRDVIEKMSLPSLRLVAHLRIRFGLALITVLFGAFACSRVAGPPAPPALPRVTVTPESRDLGVVGLGEPAVAEFLVRNEGGASLSLATPELPLGTRVDGLVPELAPGRSVSLRFTIDTLKANAETRQDWMLVTNDPDRRTVAMEVRLEVRPFLAVRPGQARYITVQHAREGTIIQTVGAVDGATFRILRIESPLPFIRVAFHEAAAAERRPEWTGSQWRVTATLPTDAPVGALTGMIVIYTDHPRQKRAFVPVSGFVRPVLAVTPPEARVGDLDRQRPPRMQMVVKNFAEELIEVTGASTDVPGIEAQIEPIERGRTWRLRLVVLPDAPLGEFSGKVLIRTASPKVPTFEIVLGGRLVESSRPR